MKQFRERLLKKKIKMEKTLLFIELQTVLSTKKVYSAKSISIISVIWSDL